MGIEKPFIYREWNSLDKIMSDINLNMHSYTAYNINENESLEQWKRKLFHRLTYVLLYTKRSVSQFCVSFVSVFLYFIFQAEGTWFVLYYFSVSRLRWNSNWIVWIQVIFLLVFIAHKIHWIAIIFSLVKGILW